MREVAGGPFVLPGPGTPVGTASAREAKAIIESISDFYGNWDVSSPELCFSDRWLASLGYSPADLSHEQGFFERFIHPDDRAIFESELKSHLAGRAKVWNCECRIRTKAGEYRWFEIRGKVARTSRRGAPVQLAGVVLDIDARKHQQDQRADVTEILQSERTLRELSQRLISSQEEERRRIARELHDNIGQRLALLCIQAQRVDSGEAAEQHTDQNDVHELYERIKGIARDISKLSHRLHSSELNFLGLGVAAERLCRDFQNQYGIDVSFTIKNIPSKLDNGKSLCFYRVLQEALQNVARHSQATRVIVELQSRKGELFLKVSDNGKGFEPETDGPGSGLGLLSVRERLNLVGGEFTLGSKPRFGTTLTATVPIE